MPARSHPRPPTPDAPERSARLSATPKPAEPPNPIVSAVDRPADYVPIDEAAARLTLTPLALRARCRRAARRVGRDVVAHLGAGVVAYKFGRSWRVHFPPAAA